MPAADIRNAPSSAYPYISHQHRQFHNNKSYNNVYIIVFVILIINTIYSILLYIQKNGKVS